MSARLSPRAPDGGSGCTAISLSVLVDLGAVVAAAQLEALDLAVLGEVHAVAGEQVHRVGDAPQLERLDVDDPAVLFVAAEPRDRLDLAARGRGHLLARGFEQLAGKHVSGLR